MADIPEGETRRGSPARAGSHPAPPVDCPANRAAGESLLIDGATQHAARLFGPGYSLRRITLTVEGPDGTRQSLSIDPAAWYLAQAALARRAAASAPAGLQADVLACLQGAGRPLKGSAIARRLDRSYSPHLRSTLAAMVRAGELARTPDGYALPDAGRDRTPDPPDAQAGRPPG